MENIPFRVGWWNIPIPLRVLFFVTMAAALAIMTYGLVRRVRLWRQGLPEPVGDRIGERLKRTLRYAVAQVRVVREKYPAVMHLAVFWSMVFLFIGTVLASLDTDVFELLLDSKLLKGGFYLFYKVVLDISALALIVGIGLALYRRYFVKPDHLSTDWRFHLTLPLLGFIGLTGLLVEAFRLAAVQPPWAAASVIGFPISRLFDGLAEPVLLGWHRGLWIVHFLAVAGLIAATPWTNLLHVFSSPANIFAAPFKTRGALRPIENLEEAETLGVSRLTHLPWPRLANLDACTECGRCQAVCPAHAAGQPLNPKQFVLDLQRHMTNSRPGSTDASSEAGAARAPTLVGDVIKHDTLWSCTTCYACVYECPVLIDHVDDIVDMRSYLAIAEGDLPVSLATTLTNIERSGNPWKQSRRKRAAWTAGVDFPIPTMAEVGEADVLWWVGCAGAYDPRNQKVTLAIARILHAAGVNFAILGEEEQCTGDAARRAGNEYLFQTLAKANIETLSQYRFKRVLTQCPHCLNSLREEYPQFGGKYEVVHHTQFIAELLRTGAIHTQRLQADAITVHDACYLGRYHDEYEAPRLLARSAGASLVEMRQSRDRAMCCGGGGARVWMEEEGDVRINRNRLTQIQETGASQVAVSCPFCLIMLEDAKGALEAENLAVLDVAEIVDRSMAMPH
jgi:Fe-S oxidoreductase/nitrate reductase gamma subunit